VSVYLYTGELTREKNIRARIIHHEGEQGMITGLSFKTLLRKNIILFAAAKNAIIPFDVTTRDKEMKVGYEFKGRLIVRLAIIIGGKF